MSSGRLTLVGVFALGVLGGAGALRLRAAPDSDEAARGKDAPGDSTRDDESAEARDLARLRRDLARLGVKATRDDASLEATPSGDATDGRATDPSAVEPLSNEAGGGELASDLLARLEHEYQASRLDAPPTVAPSATDAAAVAATVPAAVAAALPAPALLPPAAQFPAPLATPGQPDMARSAAPAEPARVADNRPVVVMGDVNQTNIQQTVNETTLNQVSVVTRYQQLLLVAPGLAGAYGGSAPAQTAAPARRPGPSPNDSNPWASTDYSSHYANPWGSAFGRPPAF